METHNTDVTIVPFKTTPKEPYISALPQNLSKHVGGSTAADRREESVEAAAAGLHANIDLDLLPRMYNVTRQRKIRVPGAADEEAIDHPALTKNFENIAPHMRVRGFRFERPARSSAAWLVAILVILGVLTAMLIMGIAISV